MALDFEQMKELEGMKHGHKKDLVLIQEAASKEDHSRKMERLEKLLEIAKAGGAGLGGGD